MHLDSIQFYTFQIFRELWKHIVSASWLWRQCDLMLCHLSSWPWQTAPSSCEKKETLLFLSCLSQGFWHTSEESNWSSMGCLCLPHGWLWEGEWRGSGEWPLGYSVALDWNDPDVFAIYPWCALPFHHCPRVALNHVQPGTALARKWPDQKPLWMHLPALLLVGDFVWL